MSADTQYYEENADKINLEENFCNWLKKIIRETQREKYTRNAHIKTKRPQVVRPKTQKVYKFLRNRESKRRSK